MYLDKHTNMYKHSIDLNKIMVNNVSEKTLPSYYPSQLMSTYVSNSKKYLLWHVGARN